MSGTAKNKAAGSGNIQSFFGGSQSKAPAASSHRKSVSRNTIEISDDEASQSSFPHVSKKLHGMQLGSDTEMKPAKPTIGKSKLKPESKSNNDNSRKRKNALVISSDEDDVDAPPPRKKAAVASEGGKKPQASVSKTTTKPKAKKVVETSESEDEDPKPPAKPAAKQKPAPSKPKPKPAPKPKAEESDLFEEEPNAKTNFAMVMARRAAGPVAPGSKGIPNGQPNCLAGLTFVFTGELDSMARDEASALVQRYGGRVTGAPSGKTSYVVVGDGAGPSKLEKIKNLGLKTLNEDQLLDMIGTREAVLDDKTVEKIRKEEEKIKQDAEEMEKRELKAAKAAKVAAKGGEKPVKIIDPTSQLWTTKYAPTQLNQICGNKGNVEKLQLWLHDWPQSFKSGFRNGGKNALNMHRALLLYGAPGLGKTTAAHLCAKLEGFTPIELNASDARNKRLVESATNVNNKSLDSWIGGGEAINAAGITITERTVLIMDEVDGMSAGDRGGVVALKALIKKTRESLFLLVPIICIANDVHSQKLKPLKDVAAHIHFTRPTAAQVKSRIASICYKEKLNIPPNVIEQLIAGAQSDIRQILNMLSTWKLSKGSMDFDESKALTEANQKYSILTPFNCTSKVLGPYLFSRTARETLNEKMEYYFHEPSLMPLFIQENYLKQIPAKTANLSGPEQALETLRLMGKASSSISDGDMVDSMLRGPEQHWSLMPLHACMSLVRPASFMYGTSAPGGGYKDSAAFPQWLGQNSKQTRLQRQLGDIQAKMRMKVSGDKSEIRRYYIPSLYGHIVSPLTDKDRDKDDAIPEVIKVIDEYYLNKEDWDTIVELGVGDRADAAVLKLIPSQTKASFTRKYNLGDHPVAFHKGTDLGVAPRKIAAMDAPDVEEMFDLDDDVLDGDEEEAKPKPKDKGINDKLIKEKKPKGTGEVKAKTTKTKAGK